METSRKLTFEAGKAIRVSGGSVEPPNGLTRCPRGETTIGPSDHQPTNGLGGRQTAAAECFYSRYVSSWRESANYWSFSSRTETHATSCSACNPCFSLSRGMGKLIELPNVQRSRSGVLRRRTIRALRLTVRPWRRPLPTPPLHTVAGPQPKRCNYRTMYWSCLPYKQRSDSCNLE